MSDKPMSEQTGAELAASNAEYVELFRRAQEASSGEEAWRDAVRELYGPEGYALVQELAARLRRQAMPESYTKSRGQDV